MRLIYPIRKKLQANTATCFIPGGQEEVVGGYRAQGWEGQVPTLGPSFHLPAPLAFIVEDVYRLHAETVVSASYGLTRHHATLGKRQGHILYHATTWA